MRGAELRGAVVVFLVCLGVGASSPRLRHVNYLAVSNRGLDELRVTAACMAHGYRPYQETLRARLVQADGSLVGSMEVGIDDERVLDVPGAEGFLALEVNSGWNLCRVSFPDGVPHAYRSGVERPMQTVGEWGPLYFHVPEGTTYFNIWVHAPVTGEGAHVIIKGPGGEVVVQQDDDFNARTKIQLRVAPEMAGKAWTISLIKPEQGQWYTDDVSLELGRHLPPYLAPEPTWATEFAGDWRYRDDAPRVERTFIVSEEPVSPYEGKRNAAMDRAYARGGGAAWRTSLPFTYVLDYGAEHLGHDAFVPRVAQAPPTLLHLGKDVPFNHGWGPIRALGGENQAYGYGDYITRLSPDEVRERMAGLRGMVRDLHDAGVRWVTPYICSMTLNGDPQRRSGFWEFYDHWDEYRGLGLCPRPEADPLQWLQTKADGAPMIYYGYAYPEEYYPRYRDNHRFAACWYHDGWRTWLLEVVRFSARCGYDGVFVDNGTSQRTQSAAALAAFRAFLAGRYTPEQARDLLGIEDIAAAAFPGPGDTALARCELQRFWAESARRQMAAIKEVGSAELGREFIVFPNGGRPEYIQRALRDCDFVMFEKSHGDYGTHPGTVLSPVFEGVRLREVNDNIFEYAFVQSLRCRVRPIILTRPGYPRRIPHLMLNADAARLGMAECAAFSGGGGFLLRPDVAVYGNALNAYRRFFESHPDLYAGLVPLAPVAVLAFAEQGWLENPAHMGRVRALTRELTQRHVLFEFISEDRFGSESLRETRALAVLDVACLSQAHLQVLDDWVQAGGQLVVSGELGSRDEAMRAREALPGVARRVQQIAVGASASWGAGVVHRVAGPGDAAVRLATLCDAAPGAQGEVGKSVRLSAYASGADATAKRMVAHVVNYSVTLGTRPEPWDELAEVSLELPLVPGWVPRQARVLSPDTDEVREIAVRVHDGVCRITIPRLRIYAVVELTP